MFLYHINALRGLAILLIILFHFNPSLFPNGYLGVEIFLVISGYLLFRSHLEKGIPSAPDFVSKKLARLFPPLIVVMFFSMIASFFFVYDNTELLVTCRTILHALLGKSNLFLSKGEGYFSPNTANNPLMHTWYTSVILQIFLFYIIISTCVRMRSARTSFALFILFAVLSLIYCILTYSNLLYPYVSRDSLYYSAPARFWEVVSGSSAIFLTRIRIGQNAKMLLSLVSLICILCISLCPVALPMYWAAPAVVCCAILTIAFAMDIKYLHSAMVKPFDIIGTISFSLYLVHYPVIVFFRNWNEKHFSNSGTIACISCIFLTASLLWFCVERRKINFRFTALMWGILFATGLLFVKSRELRQFFPDKIAAYPTYNQNVHIAASKYLNTDPSILKFSDGVRCILDKQDHTTPVGSLYSIGEAGLTPSFVVIGDSNAEHLFAGLDTICKEEHCSGLHLNSIILPFWDRESGIDDCYCCGEKKLKTFLSWLNEHKELKHVVIGQFWPCRFNGEWKFKDKEGQDATGAEQTAQALRDFCRQIRAMDREVILVAPMPSLQYTTSFKAKNLLIHKRIKNLKGEDYDDSLFSQTVQEYETLNRDTMMYLETLAQNGECKILRTKDAIFQNDDVFYAYDRETKVQYMKDATHLTPPGCILILHRLKADFMQLIGQQ